METLFDYLSVLLFVAAAGLFFYRLQRADEPLAPYVIVSLLCAGANYLGNEGAGAIAAIVLFAGAALTAYLGLAPSRGAKVDQG